MTFRSFLLALALVASVCADARAQDAAAQADVLYAEGKRLMTSGEVAKGCTKLAESQRLAPAGGTLFTLAVCREEEGRIATAWGLFKEATVIAKRDGRKDRAGFAEQRVAALEPRVPYITLVVGKEAQALQGLAVTLDGAPSSSATWDTALPIDPGHHHIVANAPGYNEWKVSVEVTEKARVVVTVGPLGRAASKPAATVLASSSAPAPPPPSPANRSSAPIAGYALLGIGAVGLGVSTWLILSGRSDSQQSETLCPTSRCDNQDGLDANDRAKTKGTWGLVAGGLGLASVGVGAYLVLSHDSRREVAVAPAPTPGGGGFTLRARW